MRALRWPIGVVLVLVVALASCTDDDARSPDRVETPAGDVGTDDDGTEDVGGEDVGGQVYDLPFGLQPVDGLTAIGRPGVSPSIDPTAAGTVQLTAAFRIDADDPAEAFEAFVAQLGESDELGFGILSVGRGDGGRGDPWLIAGAGDGRDYLDLQVWTTADQPVLLVTLVRRPGDGAVTSAVGAVDAGDPPDSPLAWDGRTDGDGLIGEQDAALHLPDGTRALMPTIPVSCGTGGSFSVLAADDGRAAIDALLAEAMASSAYGQTDGPDERVVDGVTVITAHFVIMAGGWSFDVVSVRAPEDDAATLYVTSCAD